MKPRCRGRSPQGHSPTGGLPPAPPQESLMSGAQLLPPPSIPSLGSHHRPRRRPRFSQLPQPGRIPFRGGLLLSPSLSSFSSTHPGLPDPILKGGREPKKHRHSRRPLKTDTCWTAPGDTENINTGISSSEQPQPQRHAAQNSHTDSRIPQNLTSLWAQRN